MKKTFQVVYKGTYTNEITVANYRNIADFEFAINRLKKSENLTLLFTNIAYCSL